MTEVEKRILQNQMEIIWTLSYLLACAKPDLVGRGGELDSYRDDLRLAAKNTNILINK